MLVSKKEWEKKRKWRWKKRMYMYCLSIDILYKWSLMFIVFIFSLFWKNDLPEVGIFVSKGFSRVRKSILVISDSLYLWTFLHPFSNCCCKKGGTIDITSITSATNILQTKRINQISEFSWNKIYQLWLNIAHRIQWELRLVPKGYNSF